MAERTRKTRTKKSAKPVSNLLISAKARFNSFKEKATSIPRRQLYLWLALFVIVLLAAYFKNLFVVALVNGQPIPRWTVVQQLESSGGQKALENLITETLIMQEGKKQNVLISNAEVEEEFKKLEESVTSQGQDFDEALQARELTREALKTNIRLNKTLTKLVEKDVKVTEEDIKGYLDANKDTLPKDKSEEELKKTAEEDVKQEKQSTLAQDLVAKLREEAKIDYWLNY